MLLFLFTVIAAIGDKQGNTRLSVEVALLGGSFVVLYAIARMYGPGPRKEAIVLPTDAALNARAVR
jgi:hypothetical protein